ncbi:hypothetical protein D1815_02140 [Aquimarina sp. AD1]|uniref:hypothetical protein n=1 Tax=Aquimarina TaxID=290174 RepID=UPI000480DE35|nr:MULTISPECIES: hypothetical protein [Aquimarina]AXT54606.1 hypothetical protein D1815_02140 [Aquimarina sp. AD1]RKN10010.1 hypothetical protein D7035_19620 [Aquimarina sp. AD1]
MDNEILDIINNDFKIEQRNSVIKELSSINLNHVMAESEYNLKNTRMSILYLAKGEYSEVVELTKRAKIDFRDVIMWATEEKNLKNK